MLSMAPIKESRMVHASQISRYLFSSGWELVERRNERVEIWTLRDQFEIILPLDTKFGDYAERIYESIGVISIAEQREVQDVVADVVSSGADVIRFRSDSESTHFGQIPLESMLKMVQGVKDSFVSAARSQLSLEPKAEFKSKLPLKVSSYLDNLKMGQTERGSYILTVISSFTDSNADTHHSLDIKADPFERQVVKRLNTALVEVKAITAQERDLSDPKELYKSVGRGVSINLCQAILNLQEAANGGNVDIGFDLSRTIPSAEISKVISFEAREAPTLKEVISTLKNSISDPDIRLGGKVIGLQRNEGDDVGKVVIFTLIENVERRVSMELPKETYIEAVKAHEENLHVLCSGQLTQLGKRTFQLDPVTSFQVQRPQKLSI